MSRCRPTSHRLSSSLDSPSHASRYHSHRALFVLLALQVSRRTNLITIRRLCLFKPSHSRLFHSHSLSHAHSSLAFTAHSRSHGFTHAHSLSHACSSLALTAHFALTVHSLSFAPTRAQGSFTHTVHSFPGPPSARAQTLSLGGLRLGHSLHSSVRR